MTKIEEIQNYLLDLDDIIDLKIEQILNKLFDPFELLIKNLSEIPKKIQNKIENEILSFITNQLKYVNERLNSFINSIIKRVGNENINIGNIDNKFYKNATGILDKVISKPMDLVNKLQSFCQEMDNYEKRSQEDETINILNDIIIDKLIDILMNAISSTEIGKIIADSSKKILKEMEETKKRTERKSQGVRSRFQETRHSGGGTGMDSNTAGSAPETGKASRIVDMSWAAAYLDDDWEHKYSREGGYDTKSAALAREDPLQTAGEQERSVDLMSQTQEFKAVEETQSLDPTLKIRDAVTDRTLVSVEDAHAVHEAAAQMLPEEEEDDQVKIRDAVTGKTIHSLQETEAVRSTVFSMGLDEDLDDLAQIRDARSRQMNSAAGAPKGKSFMQTMALKLPFGRKKTDKEVPDSSLQLDTELDRLIWNNEEPDVNRFIWDQEDPDMDQFIRVDSEPDAGQFIRSGKSPDASQFIDSDEESDADQLLRSDRSSEMDSFPEDEEDPDLDWDVRTDRYGSGARSDTEKRSRKSRRDSGRNPRQQNRYDRDDYYEEYIPVKSPLRFIPLVLVIAVCVFGFIATRTICYDVPINSSDYSKLSYTVTAGLTDAQLAQDLEAMGLIDNPLVFRLRCIFYDADYKEGTYELSPCFSTEKMINILSGYQYGE